MERWSPAEVNQLDAAAEVTCRRSYRQAHDVIACWTAPPPACHVTQETSSEEAAGGHLCFDLLLCWVGGEAAQTSLVSTSSSSAVLREKGKRWCLN